MQRALIVHNPTAGGAEATAETLAALVTDQGFRPDYVTTSDDLDEALQDPGDLVVAAGGDGTVRKVAVRLKGRDVPMAILGLGTANNVARGLGLPLADSAEPMMFEWRTAARRRLDLGIARGPWGTRSFVESFGIGLIAHAMPILSALKKGDDRIQGPDDVLAHDRRALAALLVDYQPVPLELSIDGRPESGAHVIVQGMNVATVGPNLRIAPAADPSDGWLDLVRAGAGERDAIASWISAGGSGTPPVGSRRVRRLSFLWRGEPLHMDGRPWGDVDAAYGKIRAARVGGGAEVTVALDTDVVQVLVPSG